jgi:hypothetical protein
MSTHPPRDIPVADTDSHVIDTRTQTARTVTVQKLPAKTIDYAGRIKICLDATDETWRFGVHLKEGRIHADQITDHNLPGFVLQLVHEAGVQEVEG